MEKCPPLEEIHVYNLVLKPILVCSSATVDHLPRSLTLSLAPSSVTLTICMSSVTASMNILCALPPFQPGSSIFSILCPLLRLSVCTNLISLTSLKTWAFPLIHSLLILFPPGHPNKTSVSSTLLPPAPLPVFLLSAFTVTVIFLSQIYSLHLPCTLFFSSLVHSVALDDLNSSTFKTPCIFTDSPVSLS